MNRLLYNQTPGKFYILCADRIRYRCVIVDLEWRKINGLARHVAKTKSIMSGGSSRALSQNMCYQNFSVYIGMQYDLNTT